MLCSLNPLLRHNITDIWYGIRRDIFIKYSWTDVNIRIDLREADKKSYSLNGGGGGCKALAIRKKNFFGMFLF